VRAMRTVSGSLRLDLSQYRELEAFAAFGSDLDAASAAALGRGSRLVELLKQPQYTPFSVAHAALSIWTGTSGQLDDVPVEDIRRFESELLDYMHREHKGLVDTLAETKDLTDDTVSSLTDALNDFKKQFETHSGEMLVNDEPVGAMDKDEVEQEKITKHVRKPASQS
jgi:F-type H+/Na+-transporting ATPase subunit alpha